MPDREAREPDASRWDDEGGREPWEGERRGGFPRYAPGQRAHESHAADFGQPGDWGRQGSWGTYGNRPSFERESWPQAHWSEEGRFAGMGPKSWRRPDARIVEDINQRLTDNPRIDATEIEVAVHEGEVTLSGNVHDRGASRMAEDLAEGVAGVKGVHNRLNAA